ncbi:MAG: hypothetical protein ACLQA5_10615 [Solirubrobacteraceae bacterium]
MRGGAIPIFAWGTILLVLAVGNWVWNDRWANSGAASAAVLIIYLFGVAVWLARRKEALRRGPPEPSSEPESVPQASLAAAGIGVSAGCALFGLAWARFLLDLGIALFILALGRLILEVRAERASRRAALGEEPRQ